MKKYILLIFLVILCKFSFAQDESQFVKRNFVIIHSAKNYSDAKSTAKNAAKILKLKLNLRGLQPNKTTGLTLSKKECKNNGWEYPNNYGRGRFDDGEYVSIE
jgi:hypothetical protein